MGPRGASANLTAPVVAETPASRTAVASSQPRGSATATKRVVALFVSSPMSAGGRRLVRSICRSAPAATTVPSLGCTIKIGVSRRTGHSGHTSQVSQGTQSMGSYP